jgi:hypothetical protein
MSYNSNTADSPVSFNISGTSNDKPLEEVVKPKTGTIADFVNKLVNILFVIGMGLGPLIILYGAFLYVTAAGEIQKIARAKQVIIWAVIGMVVLLFIKGIQALITSLI